MGGELRVEMKDWQTCQLNTAGGIPEVLEMWSCHKNHHTRHTPQLQLLHTQRSTHLMRRVSAQKNRYST